MKNYLQTIVLPLALMAVAFWTFSAFSKPDGNDVNASALSLQNLMLKRLSNDKFEIHYMLLNKVLQKEILPQKISVRVLDSKQNLIATSAKSIIAIPDASLPSEEELNVEITVSASGSNVKQIQKIKASKKKVLVSKNIVYPIKKQIFAGACEVKPQLFRLKWNTADEWEEIYTSSKEWFCYLTVREQSSSKKIALPLKTGASKFNLQEAAQYETFRPEIEEAIIAKGEAILLFNVEVFRKEKRYLAEEETFALAFKNIPKPEQNQSAKFKKENMPLQQASFTKTIALGSQSDLQQFLKVWAAAHIKSYFVTPADLKIILHDWEFDTNTNKYFANVSVQWSNDLIREEKYVIKGNFQITKGGVNPTFNRTFANETIRDIEKYRVERAMK